MNLLSEAAYTRGHRHMQRWLGDGAKGERFEASFRTMCDELLAEGFRVGRELGDALSGDARTLGPALNATAGSAATPRATATKQAKTPTIAKAKGAALNEPTAQEAASVEISEATPTTRAAPRRRGRGQKAQAEAPVEQAAA